MNALKEWLEEQPEPRIVTAHHEYVKREHDRTIALLKMARLIAEPTPELVEAIYRRMNSMATAQVSGIALGKVEIAACLAALASALPGMVKGGGE